MLESRSSLENGHLRKSFEVFLDKMRERKKAGVEMTLLTNPKEVNLGYHNPYFL
jgi:hypothetical protein